MTEFGITCRAPERDSEENQQVYDSNELVTALLLLQRRQDGDGPGTATVTGA